MIPGGVLLEIEQGEEVPLLFIHSCQASGGGRLVLALAAGVNDERFANASQFFQHAVDAEFFAFLSQFPLQQ